MRAYLAIPLLLLAGCDAEMTKAPDTVKRRMLNPAAAQFREVTRCPKNPKLITGEVSGAKGDGSRTDFRMFVVSGEKVSLDGDVHFRSFLIGCYGKDFVNEVDETSMELTGRPAL